MITSEKVAFSGTKCERYVTVSDANDLLALGLNPLEYEPGNEYLDTNTVLPCGTECDNEGTTYVNCSKPVNEAVAAIRKKINIVPVLIFAGLVIVGVFIYKRVKK